MTKVPHDAVVFVGDGRKALFLRNEGDAQSLNLKAEAVFEHQNPATRMQGTDRPGRLSKGPHSGQRSAVESPNWHDIEEHRFTKQVAAAAEQLLRSGSAKMFVIVAPPRTLAELRMALHADVYRHVVAEIPKDLTKLPVWEIEKHLLEVPA
ncbi:protein required for attachment to host cells [Bradyrhizobium elkanii]|jgi:protein required for attachment to host cells|uniref:Protein required for attachment to host cells n=1 Tax=Bradyrhizobium elkanii TaxID=29448 RepID=A0A1E3EY14_BRAEL|nr:MULTISPECIES: host attachment family protein [Bradyrhizobium]MBP1290910.1 protein required for attachment to host cells [Bradyrhizobium elkanii]MCP1928776.1 protein required for attachment to host cells [Bradyrhizobium elkanii]MCS3473904.1 protein required for attachment to host cells [Bradyrhizobium elkanii]MCS3580610.1 protein required for attachment to host cells [Bradyrhizobium elkanii]MCS3723486.1 protein required for attachment to host cells [Bradyrhizobium elkanii]